MFSKDIFENAKIIINHKNCKGINCNYCPCKTYSCASIDNRINLAKNYIKEVRQEKLRLIKELIK